MTVRIEEYRKGREFSFFFENTGKENLTVIIAGVKKEDVEFLPFEVAHALSPKCQSCGCSEVKPCKGGCSWAKYQKLCSKCAGKVKKK